MKYRKIYKPIVIVFSLLSSHFLLLTFASIHLYLSMYPHLVALRLYKYICNLMPFHTMTLLILKNDHQLNLVTCIPPFCGSLSDLRGVWKIKTFWIGMISQYTSRGGTLRSQLASMATMLPTIQMHLMLCTTFTSTANKHEFITMAYQLIDRLAALAHLTYPLR